jgi:hypothetical protein
MMTIQLAILLIIILLIYDFMFLKMLSRRKKKTLFTIYIDNAQVTSIDGKVPEKFLLQVKAFISIYKPEKVKLSCNKVKQSYELQFLGDATEELRNKLNSSWANSP